MVNHVEFHPGEGLFWTSQKYVHAVPPFAYRNRTCCLLVSSCVIPLGVGIVSKGRGKAVAKMVPILIPGDPKLIPMNIDSPFFNHHLPALLNAILSLEFTAR